jgi:hypothetical protein
MYDVIHGAIARERVRELVETAGAERAARRRRGSDARQAEPQPVPEKPRAGRRVSLRGLRPRPR